MGRANVDGMYAWMAIADVERVSLLRVYGGR